MIPFLPALIVFVLLLLVGYVLWGAVRALLQDQQTYSVGIVVLGGLFVELVLLQALISVLP